MAIVPNSSSDLLSAFLRDVSGGAGDLVRSPRTDVMETETEIRVTAELPGLSPDEISIDLDDNVLTIRGEKNEESSEGGEGQWHLSERRFGRFSRSFVLPRDVEQEQIHARCENGVLEITIPKSERARRRRIDIQGRGSSREVAGGDAPEERSQ